METMKSVFYKYSHRLKSNRAIYTLLLLLPSILIFIFLLKNGTQYCCDAVSYLHSIQGYQENGLFHHIGSYGYRSYLFPFLYSLFPLNMSHTIEVFNISILMYSLVSIALFLIIEYVVLYLFWGKRFFILFYTALFLNPLLMVYIAYPLQESFFVLLFLLFIPLIFSAYVKKNSYLLLMLLGLFFSTMYMARASHLLLLVPILVIGLYYIYKSKQRKSLLFLVFILSSISFIVPQSLLMLKSFNTLNPYPKTSVLDMQFKYGNVYSKYGTNLSENPKLSAAQPYWNPLACSTEKSKDTRNIRSFECSVQNESPVHDFTSLIQNNSFAQLFFKSSLHIFNALNYDYFKPYVTSPPKLFSWHQILSMLLVFLGTYQIIKSYILRQANAFDVFLDLIIVVTLGVCLFFAIETRFGLLATIVFSIKSMQLLLYNRPRGSEMIALAIGSFFFLLSTSLLSVYILSLSGALN